MARKCVELVGSSMIDDGAVASSTGDRYHVELGVDDEVSAVANGKEFSLMQTSGGKLYFTGKSVAIGHKQPCSPGRWNEAELQRRSSKVSKVTLGLEPVSIVSYTWPGSSIKWPTQKLKSYTMPCKMVCC